MVLATASTGIEMSGSLLPPISGILMHRRPFRHDGGVAGIERLKLINGINRFSA
jgi:hypothetical protein